MPIKSREARRAYERAYHAKKRVARPPSWPGGEAALLRAGSVPVIDVAYIAGLFDGEGCITSHVAGRTTKRPSLSISVSGAFRETLDWIKRLFGGYVRANNKGSANKTVFVWNPGTTHEKLGFLTAIRPFLREKASQADLAIGYLTVRITQPRRGMHATNADTDELALAMRDALSEIKAGRNTVMALQGTTA